jgi:hypothetical protein
MPFFAQTRGQTNRARLVFDGIYRATSNSKTGAAASAACVQHCATTLGFHADEETVGTGALGDGGLIGSFHDVFG